MEILRERKMKVPLIDLTKTNQRIKSDFLKQAADIVDSGGFIDGQIVKRFEQSFANFCGAKYCVAVNSGTSAIHLSIAALGRESPNILTAPNSFFATVEAASYQTRQIEFRDVGNDLNIHPQEDDLWMQDVIIPVSLYGNPAPVDEFSDNNYIIHDACQAHGARIKGQKIGKFGTATCFSFYPSKNLGAFGEGGAIVTNSESFANDLRILKNHGQTERYVHDRIGYNYRMDELQALALLLKIPFLESDIQERQRINDRYRRNLAGTSIGLLDIHPKNQSAHHIMPIFVQPRQKYCSALDKAGIGYGSHYPTLITNQEPYRAKWHGKFPKAEVAAASQISIPMYIGLTDDQIDYVSETLLSVCQNPS